MSEYASGYNNHPEQTALLEVMDVLNGMKPEQLTAERERLLEEVSDRETMIHRINNVLDGYGIE